MQELLQKINEKLKSTPLIYFSREAERGIGLEDLLENYFVASSEFDHISSSLKNGFSLMKDGNYENEKKSTLELIKDDRTKSWLDQLKIRIVGKDHTSPFYAMTFQNIKPIKLNIEALGGTLLNNDFDLSNKFEDKLIQYKILQENNIKIPKGFIKNISEVKADEVLREFPNGCVVQTQRSHTGTGTYFVKNQEEFVNLEKELQGNLVKFTELIDGVSLTANACIAFRKIFINGLQFQITGIPELTPGLGSTVGNDFTYANKLDKKIKDEIFVEIQKLGEILKSEGYRGLFGLDLVLDKNTNEIYIIEINARQTANIPLQTKLEIKANKTPLLLLHIAEFLDIQDEAEPETEFSELIGSQIFLRSKRDSFEIKNELHSGIYRLQSDNSAKDWNSMQVKENVILIDEDGDKPLIKIKDGYNVNDIEEAGFLALFQQKGLIKNKFEELARFQFLDGIIADNNVHPWILEALIEIEKLLS